MWINTFSLDRHVLLRGHLRLESSCIWVNVLSYHGVFKKFNLSQANTKNNTISGILEVNKQQLKKSRLKYIGQTGMIFTPDIMNTCCLFEIPIITPPLQNMYLLMNMP